MANICFNKVFITGSARSLDALEKAIADKAGEVGVALEALLPPPAGLPYDSREELFGEFADALDGNTDRQYSTEYHWRIAFHGTKAVYPGGTRIRIDDNLMILEYQSAWAPNLEYWHNVIKATPRFLDLVVNHRYYEDGLGFIGEAKIDQTHLINKQKDLTIEHWKQAGAIVMDDEILWESTDNVDLFDAFPV